MRRKYSRRRWYEGRERNYEREIDRGREREKEVGRDRKERERERERYACWRLLFFSNIVLLTL